MKNQKYIYLVFAYHYDGNSQLANSYDIVTAFSKAADAQSFVDRFPKINSSFAHTNYIVKRMFVFDNAASAHISLFGVA